MARIKLVYLGGGSTRAAGTMASFMANGADFDGSEVVLIDLDDDRLALIRTLAEKMARVRGLDIAVTATTDRRAALDTEQPGIAPDEAHDPLRPRPLADRADERLRHGIGGDRPQPRVHEQPHARRPLRGLFLDQLIVGGNPAEAPGQHLLEHPDHVALDQRRQLTQHGPVEARLAERECDQLDWACSGNSPGIHRAASAAGKAMNNGARVLSEESTPRSSRLSTSATFSITG